MLGTIVPAKSAAQILLCPRCGHPIRSLRLNQPEIEMITCGGCGSAFTSYYGVMDLRIQVQRSCWSDARMVAEDVLVHRLVAKFHRATLEELVDEYVDAHRLPERLLDADREYMKLAQAREAWSVRYVGFCLKRYAARGLKGVIALDAGCGSGGMLPHLADRFEHSVGVDVDLPSLIIAAKRCVEQGIADRVRLVAAMLEQNIFAADTFDTIKCTDVIEHVSDPDLACLRMITALKEGGALFILTPNKWSPWSPEPHVRLWGVQFLPARVADSYVRRRIGVPYRNVARLLSYDKFMQTLRRCGQVDIFFVPVEDKHLNPESRRGVVLKKAFERWPMRWLSQLARPIQPSLEALCIKRATD